MQPPPPAGCTGKAPPGAGGAGGWRVTVDEVTLAAVATAGDDPNAKASPAAHNAATVLAC